MNDLISRQAAIDALKNRWLKTRNYEGIGEDIAEECEIYLRAVPSAQTESCEDTVSRQRLLSDLKELVVAWEKYPVMAEQIKGVEAAIGYVETIPSAQPKSGRWAITNLGVLGAFDCCSKCKRVVSHKEPLYNFCPHCGAKMEGVSNES